MNDLLDFYTKALRRLSNAFYEIHDGNLPKAPWPEIPAADRLELVDVEYCLLSARNAFSDYVAAASRSGLTAKEEREAAAAVGARIDAARLALIRVKINQERRASDPDALLLQN